MRIRSCRAPRCGKMTAAHVLTRDLQHLVQEISVTGVTPASGPAAGAGSPRSNRGGLGHKAGGFLCTCLPKAQQPPLQNPPQRWRRHRVLYQHRYQSPHPAVLAAHQRATHDARSAEWLRRSRPAEWHVDRAMRRVMMRPCRSPRQQYGKWTCQSPVHGIYAV